MSLEVVIDSWYFGLDEAMTKPERCRGKTVSNTGIYVWGVTWDYRRKIKQISNTTLNANTG